MNNDLEQFSEERLKQLASGKYAGTGLGIQNREVAPLARIALEVKQAKPVAWVSEYQLAMYRQSDDGYLVCQKINVFNDGLQVYTTPQPAHTEQVIPEGWKLVPMTATIEMHKAAEKEYSLQKMYSAMLRAAPKPESD